MEIKISKKTNISEKIYITLDKLNPQLLNATILTCLLKYVLKSILGSNNNRTW